jgi:hypothetical protein
MKIVDTIVSVAQNPVSFLQRKGDSSFRIKKVFYVKVEEADE